MEIAKRVGEMQLSMYDRKDDPLLERAKQFQYLTGYYNTQTKTI